MTSTTDGLDELRRMLDERGVEWEGSERSIRWRDRNGIMMQAFPLASGELGLEVWSCTPEQAIAATLGAGTCHDKNGFDPDTGFECTVCGAMVDSYMVTPNDTGHEVQFNYCPFCGRVVDA